MDGVEIRQWRKEWDHILDHAYQIKKAKEEIDQKNKEIARNLAMIEDLHNKLNKRVDNRTPGTTEYSRLNADISFNDQRETELLQNNRRLQKTIEEKENEIAAERKTLQNMQASYQATRSTLQDRIILNERKRDDLEKQKFLYGQRDVQRLQNDINGKIHEDQGRMRVLEEFINGVNVALYGDTPQFNVKEVALDSNWKHIVEDNPVKKTNISSNAVDYMPAKPKKKEENSDITLAAYPIYYSSREPDQVVIEDLGGFLKFEDDFAADYYAAIRLGVHPAEFRKKRMDAKKVWVKENGDWRVVTEEHAKSKGITPLIRRDDEKIKFYTKEEEQKKDMEMQKFYFDYILEEESCSVENWRHYSREEKNRTMEDLIEVLNETQGTAVNCNIHYYSDEEFLRDNPDEDSVPDAYYNHVDNKIHIRKKAFDAETSYDYIKIIAHEMRHAYQYYAVSSPAKYNVSYETLRTWKYNQDHKIIYRKDDRDSQIDYWLQAIEWDAKGFANQLQDYVMKLQQKEFSYRSIIPPCKGSWDA